MTDKAKKSLTQPAFLICAALLGVAGAGKVVAITLFPDKNPFAKEPIELQKPFDQLDEEKLLPYKVIRKDKIQNPEVVESLGTEDYIQWTIEDTSAGENTPVRYCSLFITYYSKPDRVPHVPEECYIGSGNEQLGRQSLDINVENKEDPIEIRHLIFGPANTALELRNSKFSRMYVFSVNGKYANDRAGVRAILGANIFGRHSYFSKVEWEFFGLAFGRRIRPRIEDDIAASEKLLSKLLKVLENEHWPEIEE